jgi:hypothetical protein
VKKRRPGYKVGGAQHKRPGRTALQERRRGALDRLLEKNPMSGEVPILMKALGMSVQETK